MSTHTQRDGRYLRLVNKSMAGVAILLLSASAFVAAEALTAADEAAAFESAGFRLTGTQWRLCDDPTATYTPGVIQEVRDLNGDGLPEAVITEGGSYCYGHTGAGYSLVSKQADGQWKLITNGTGILLFMTTRGADGWPDIQIGGPGFCFPVERWNGHDYVLDRHEYEGKRCDGN